MAEIEIGPLAPANRPAWEELFRGYYAFYERECTPQALDRAWEAFARDDVLHALGAHIDGRLAGIAHFLFHANTTGPDVCYLQDLFTVPDLRGGGVGRALIAAVTDRARAHGCGRVYWMTHESNATARRLYDTVAAHRGFIRYELET